MDLIKIPPFKDSHIHFMIDGKPALPSQWNLLKEKYLSSGIFFLDDLGHKSGLGLEVKNFFCLEGDPYPLSVRTAGKALFKKGTYGGFLGEGIAGREEIKRSIKKLFRAGVDFLKVINSGLVDLQVQQQVTQGGFSSEEWKILSEMAKEYRLTVRCHANSDSAIRKALYGGVTSIEHGFFISKEALHQMKESGISWTPTGYALLAAKVVLPEEKQGVIDRIMESHLESICYAASIGLTLRVGTDSGAREVVHGGSFFEELRIFKKAGLSLDQIIRAACMGSEEIEKGNYLLVRKDFIEQGRVEKFFIKGEPIRGEL